MRIECEFTPEDRLAFAEYCVTSSEYVKAMLNWYRWVSMALIMAGAAFEAYRERSLNLIVVGFVLAVLWWSFLPWFFRRLMRFQALRSRLQCLDGPHTMELSSEGLQVRCDSLDNRHRWTKVRELASSDTHGFIMLGDCIGYAIPFTGIRSGDLDHFLEAAKSHKASESPNENVRARD